MNARELFEGVEPDQIFHPFGRGPQIVVVLGLEKVLPLLARLDLIEQGISDLNLLGGEPGQCSTLREFQVKVERETAYGLFGFIVPGGGGSALEAAILFGLAPLGMEALFLKKLRGIRDKMFASLKRTSRRHFAFPSVSATPKN
jgi:hypothetical protein